jgi:hypothetical protein
MADPPEQPQQGNGWQQAAPQYDAPPPPYGYPPQQMNVVNAAPPRRGHGRAFLGLIVIAVIVAAVAVHVAKKTGGGVDASDPGCQLFKSQMVVGSQIPTPPANSDAATYSSYDYEVLQSVADLASSQAQDATVAADLSTLQTAAGNVDKDQIDLSTLYPTDQGNLASDVPAAYSAFETVAGLCGIS